MSKEMDEAKRILKEVEDYLDDLPEDYPLGGLVITFGGESPEVVHPPYVPRRDYLDIDCHMPMLVMHGGGMASLGMVRPPRRPLWDDLIVPCWDDVAYQKIHIDMPDAKEKSWELKGFIPESGDGGICCKELTNKERAKRKRQRKARKKARR